MKIHAALPALIAAGFLAGCAAQSSPAPASPAAPATSAAPSATAQPMTAAAARSAASAYFDLYAGGQYAATYALLSPAARRVISEQTWAGAHQQCVKQTQGLAYAVARPVLAGDTAVVNVSLAGAASKLGSEEASFTYSAGRWWYSPPNLAVYQHHTTTQAVAALKAAGDCG